MCEAASSASSSSASAVHAASAALVLRAWSRSDLDGWDAQLPVPCAEEAVELVPLRRPGTADGTEQQAALDPGGVLPGQPGPSPTQQGGTPSACKRILRRRLAADYRLQSKVLGSGIAGDVHLATSRHSGRRVAVKSFDRLGPGGPEGWAEAQSEVDIYMSLSHPNIAQLYAVYDERDALHIVMECLEGGELFSRLVTCKRYAEAEAADVARQVLSALAYLHAHGVVHCDVKLENILYETSQSKHVKIIDFGFAQRLESGRELSRRCGSLRYMAPEVLKRSYTEKADVWSVGAVVYMLLVGRSLYSGLDGAVRTKVGSGKPDYAPSFGSLSDGAQAFVRSLLAADPAQRPTASSALRHPWLRCYASAQGSVGCATIRSLNSFADTPRSQRRLLLAAASALPDDDQAVLREQLRARRVAPLMRSHVAKLHRSLQRVARAVHTPALHALSSF